MTINSGNRLSPLGAVLNKYLEMQRCETKQPGLLPELGWALYRSVRGAVPAALWPHDGGEEQQ